MHSRSPADKHTSHLPDHASSGSPQPQPCHASSGSPQPLPALSPAAFCAAVGSSLSDLEELYLCLQSMSKEAASSFSDAFREMTRQNAQDIPSVILRSGIERTYAYQILNGRRPRPGRDKIFRLALAAGLSVAETAQLLLLSEKAPLRPTHRRDVIVFYALAHHCSVEDTLSLLEHYREAPLT